jgi:hypothetical protein
MESPGANSDRKDAAFEYEAEQQKDEGGNDQRYSRAGPPH